MKSMPSYLTIIIKHAFEFMIKHHYCDNMQWYRFKSSSYIISSLSSYIKLYNGSDGGFEMGLSKEFNNAIMHFIFIIY